jgi:hypothetical protein
MWGIGLIDQAEDRERWWALVNVAMYLWVHKFQGISGLDKNRLASQEVLCSRD